MKVVFMGTPDFAVPTLEALFHSGSHTVLEVITQPDRPKGRGKHLASPPVKEKALELGLSCYQPSSVRSSEFLDHLKLLNPDVIVVVAYGKILPPEVIGLPPFGCVNVHSSLLPEFRGAAPIHWAIYHGKKESGVTTMFMNEGLDTGDMLLKVARPISPEMTMGELHDQLKIDGAELLLKTLDGLEKKSIVPIVQKDEESSYAPLIKKENEKIDWNRTAEEIHNQIRAFNPWPGTYTIFRGERLKIWKTSYNSNFIPHSLPGVITIQEENLLVSTGLGVLILEEVQPQSREKVGVKNWISGKKVQTGEQFFEE